ncbi:hypothetical protein THICB2_630022 [Thiomonas sp. CB2]|nr:hypothetical protein THICB2_630022 [Thiomonas sp. CB2]VDY03860.1 protein of unknown function [Thiomonas sp. Bio17B3]VDY08963.1 protein of unknown function [Thiomonas sp. Sup16B3]VDY12109.1 conserved protein of unknown function [Thiomonas sp. OC7]VDY18674.1 protein of unknown function [Thiomonas sp. CB2]
MAKNGGVDALWRRICRSIAVAMEQKTAGAGRRSAILQPAILKSDRLLGFSRQNRPLKHAQSTTFSV